MWGDSVNVGVDAKVMFHKYRFLILFIKGVLKATLIKLCVILTEYLQINILKFVTGHYNIVQRHDQHSRL